MPATCWTSAGGTAGLRPRCAAPSASGTRPLPVPRLQFPAHRHPPHHPWAKGGKTRLRSLISLCEAHHVIVHELGYLIAPTEGSSFAFTRPDGTSLPASPPLPATSGDISNCHDVAITEDTIVPNWNGDKLDPIWASFANARLAEELSPA
jgi:hypothetical protein